MLPYFQKFCLPNSADAQYEIYVRNATISSKLIKAQNIRFESQASGSVPSSSCG